MPTLRSVSRISARHSWIPRTEPCTTWCSTNTARSTASRSTTSRCSIAGRPGRPGPNACSNAARVRARRSYQNCREVPYSRARPVINPYWPANTTQLQPRSTRSASLICSN